MVACSDLTQHICRMISVEEAYDIEPKISLKPDYVRIGAVEHLVSCC